MTQPDALEPGLDALGPLVDDTRRAAYRVVAGSPEPIGRDEVAAAIGIGRTLAAFHLDKLVEAGLLETSFARRSGRSGPGAGRTAKLYRCAQVEHAAFVPPRAYRSAAELFAETIERAGLDETLFQVAREHGRAAAAAGAELLDVLRECGYEPAPDEGAVRLRNCPFHRLAQQFPPLVCGMNLALLRGVVEGAGLSEWRADIDPRPGACCVAFSTNSSKNNED